jgi:hypothetical protein
VHGPKCTVPGSPAPAAQSLSLFLAVVPSMAAPSRAARSSTRRLHRHLREEEEIRPKPCVPPGSPCHSSLLSLARLASFSSPDPEPGVAVAALPHHRGHRRRLAAPQCRSSPLRSTTSTGARRRSRGAAETPSRTAPLCSDAGDPLRPPACSEPSPSRFSNGDHLRELTNPSDILFPLCSHRSHAPSLTELRPPPLSPYSSSRAPSA